MATARVPEPVAPHLLVGQTVHYRDGRRCWAAAIVGSGPNETAQLYLFPLPPNVPMPQAPGTYVPHDGGTQEASWHRMVECLDAPAPWRPRAKRRRRSSGSAAEAKSP
ncbi:MAG TPA: hypothetical protein VFN76_06680 [Candidatus Limnocylindria bacterium]|nr:hypothetical protein [Candidatus Limnocylindria bacterium]